MTFSITSHCTLTVTIDHDKCAKRFSAKSHFTEELFVVFHNANSIRLAEMDLQVSWCETDTQTTHRLVSDFEL